jgi:hypothetical protein
VICGDFGDSRRAKAAKPPNVFGGTVAERPNAPALKADVGRLTESSNLSRSALDAAASRHRGLGQINQAQPGEGRVPQE